MGSFSVVWTKPGLRRRYCIHNPEHYEEEIIDALFVYEVVEGEGGTWKKGSNKDLKFVIKRSYDDAVTFDSFDSVVIDGKKIAADQYTIAKGSLILNVKAACLQELSAGTHALKVVFKDGNCQADFTVKKSSSNDSSATPKEYYKLPVTGVE